MKGSISPPNPLFIAYCGTARQLKHRRAERQAKPRFKPRALCATAPNQLYSWDITYLPSRIKGQYFYLYLFLDIFSRKIVGWQVYAEESAQHASDMIKDICQREGILPGQVTLHSDNGSPMKGAILLFTLETLGIATSLSRPSLSNDIALSTRLTLLTTFKTPAHGSNTWCTGIIKSIATVPLNLSHLHKDMQALIKPY
nr:DDE-type integrase/transposase/recombinase [Candidatus Regiella insecticola]